MKSSFVSSSVWRSSPVSCRTRHVRVTRTYHRRRRRQRGGSRSSSNRELFGHTLRGHWARDRAAKLIEKKLNQLPRTIYSATVGRRASYVQIPRAASAAPRSKAAAAPTGRTVSVRLGCARSGGRVAGAASAARAVRAGRAARVVTAPASEHAAVVSHARRARSARGPFRPTSHRLTCSAASSSFPFADDYKTIL